MFEMGHISHNEPHNHCNERRHSPGGFHHVAAEATSSRLYVRLGSIYHQRLLYPLSPWFNCWGWDVMRCWLSSVKCCCPHRSPDPASPGVCVSISLLQIFTCLSLNSTSVPVWSYFPVSIFWCPSLLSNVSRAGPFFCPASSPTLQGTIDPDRDAVGQHMRLSPHPNLFPHLIFFSSCPRRLSFFHHGPRGQMARGEAGHQSLRVFRLLLDIVRPQHWPHVRQLRPGLDSHRGSQWLGTIRGAAKFAFHQSVLGNAEQGVGVEGDIFSWKWWVSRRALASLPWSGKSSGRIHFNYTLKCKITYLYFLSYKNINRNLMESHIDI